MSLSNVKLQGHQLIDSRYPAGLGLKESLAAAHEEVASIDWLAGNLDGEGD